MGLLDELLNLSVEVAAVQVTHFICAVNYLERDFVTFSAYGSHSSARITLLAGHGLDVDVNIVFAGDEGQLVMVDVAVKSFKFWVVAVYVPNIIAERASLFFFLFFFFFGWCHS